MEGWAEFAYKVLIPNQLWVGKEELSSWQGQARHSFSRYLVRMAKMVQNYLSAIIVWSTRHSPGRHSNADYFSASNYRSWVVKHQITETFMHTQPYVLSLPALSGLPSQAGYSLPRTCACHSCPSLPVPVPFLLLLSQKLVCTSFKPYVKHHLFQEAPSSSLYHPLFMPQNAWHWLLIISPKPYCLLYSSPHAGLMCAGTVSYLFLDFLCLPQSLTWSGS